MQLNSDSRFDPLSRAATALRDQVSPSPAKSNHDVRSTPRHPSSVNRSHQRHRSASGCFYNEGFTSPYVTSTEKRPITTFAEDEVDKNYHCNNDNNNNIYNNSTGKRILYSSQKKKKTPNSKHHIYASGKSSLASVKKTPIPPFISPAASLPNTGERNLVQKFDEEFRQAIQDEEIETEAKQKSVRDITVFTVWLSALYLMLGCFYYSVWNKESQWPLEESLIFLIYTVTTVGYGNHDIPTSPGSRVVTMLFILIGIALVTVLFSEIFQFIVINAARERHIHDEDKITLRAIKSVRHLNVENNDESNDDDGNGDVENQQQNNRIQMFINGGMRRGHTTRTLVFGSYTKMKEYVQSKTIGRYLIALFPFVFLLLIGSVVVGCIEGWSVIDSIYWAVVTLTTVGYGDLSPSKPASIWFSIFYLPTATIFLSLFLSHVASAYIQLHVAQVMRIERRLRKKFPTLEEDEPLAVLKEIPSGETDDSSPERPQSTTKIIATPKPSAKKMKMKDLLSTAQKLDRKKKSILAQDATTPPLSLRGRVQERLAFIVSTEFCKEEPKVEIKGGDVALSFLNWKEVTDTWMIPKKAKGVFKAVSCEVILSVGTNALRQEGLNALLDLESNEFQNLFNPFTVAMGSAECMEAWMLSTETLVKEHSTP